MIGHLQIFSGHDGPVSCGGFTLDGKFVFTGGEDGTVRVWLPKSGACKHVFEVHETMITCCEGSQDGDLIISGLLSSSIAMIVYDVAYEDNHNIKAHVRLLS